MGEVSQIGGGGTPSTSNDDYWNGDVNWFAPAEIDDRIFISESNRKITQLGLKSSSAKILPIGTVLFTSRAGIGKTAILSVPSSTNQGFQSIIPDGKNLDTYFIYSRTNELKRYAETVGAGSTFVEVSGKQMEKMPIKIPKLDEQNKIGAFFKNLDNTITLHQRKLELLKELKKAYLQNLFPENGEKNPRIRFSDFTEDWEQCRLGDVADIIGGGTPSTSNSGYWNGEIDWYSPVEIGEQIYVSGSQKKITKLGLEKSSARMLPVGAVLFTSRAGIGNTAILAKEACTNQGFQSVIPHKNELDTYFIYSRTHELKRYGEVTGAGSTFVEVSGKQMAQMPMLIPNFNEQFKIGSFFSTLDRTITFYQRKLESMQNIKKSLLQKMFI